MDFSIFSFGFIPTWFFGCHELEFQSKILFKQKTEICDTVDIGQSFALHLIGQNSEMQMNEWQKAALLLLITNRPICLPDNNCIFCIVKYNYLVHSAEEWFLPFFNSFCQFLSVFQQCTSAMKNTPPHAQIFFRTLFLFSSVLDLMYVYNGLCERQWCEKSGFKNKSYGLCQLQFDPLWQGTDKIFSSIIKVISWKIDLKIPLKVHSMKYFSFLSLFFF